MLRCQRDDLFASIPKEWIAADEERTDAILHHGRERGVDVVRGSGSQENELQPDGACRIGRIGDQLVQQPQPLGGPHLLASNAQSGGEIDAAFASIVQSRAGALLIGNSILFHNRRRQLAALAARHGVPAIAGIREFVLVGGLMSYGASDTDAYRRAGSHYVASILRGTKPGDLPVEMPTKYELVISVVAAKALGLEIPDKLLALADEVIE